LGDSPGGGDGGGTVDLGRLMSMVLLAAITVSFAVLVVSSTMPPER
jgi:hypothetical protein